MNFAETDQRVRISAFFRERNIPIPNFSSPSDLADAISAALDHLDGGGSNGPKKESSAAAQLHALRLRRDELERERDAGILEASRLQARLDEIATMKYRFQAMEVLAAVEAKVGKAIRQPPASALAIASQDDIYEADNDDNTIELTLPDIPMLESSGGLAPPAPPPSSANKKARTAAPEGA